jgi:Right handed beta helix region
MKRFLQYAALGTLVMSMATIANAQATRTWVSGVGDDVNPCSRTAPCKTWAGAISKTAAGGEIDALDPGGFGAVTITKSMTLDGTGQLASTLVSGGPGIVINDSTGNAKVIIRGLSIQGANSGTNGISFVNGKSLTVDNCIIQNFTLHAISVTTPGANTQVVIRDTAINEAGQESVFISPSGGNVLASINNCKVAHSGSSIVHITSNTKLSVTGSEFTQAAVGAGLTVDAASSEADLDTTTLANNAFGLFVGVAGGTPTVRITHCLITGNTSSGVAINSGSVIGFGTNTIEGNAGNNTITTHASQ